MENSVHHSFNARNLTPDEVAYSFIENIQFKQLVSLNHSLLLGPRGCGKTTLLKMLSPKTIHIWNNIPGNSCIKLPFYGIYIPTDNQWKKQLIVLEEAFPVFPEFSKAISIVIVNTNIVKSIISTFFQLLEIYEHEEDEKFFKDKKGLCVDLINILELEKPISPDLFAIELAIRKRLTYINELIYKARITQIINIGELPGYFHTEFYDLISACLLAFKKNFYGNINFKKSHFRWALCFDELELAPEWLQEKLISQLRSREDQSILYKLTSTPIISMEKSMSDFSLESSDFNDYNVIRAWTFNQSEFTPWNEFSRKLAKLKMTNLFRKDIEPEDIFGNYDIEYVLRNMKLADRNEIVIYEDLSWDSNFKKGTLMWHLIKYLAHNDRSFRRYLDLKNISYHNPSPSNVKQMGPIYRKMKPIIIYRSQFIRNNNLIPRRNIPFYHGVNNIFEICDGNPRFLTGLIETLLKEVDEPKKTNLTPEKQSEIIYKISERHFQIISSHPSSSIEIYGKQVNLGDLIAIIGNYFFYFMYGNDFTIEPVGSFVVDQNVNDEIVNLINLGVRLGAFVYIDPKEAISDSGIVGKRFRLSYILHPYFKLPIREYGHRKLSSILKDEKKSNSTLNLFSEDYEN